MKKRKTNEAGLTFPMVITHEGSRVLFSDVQPFWPYRDEESRVGFRRVFGDTLYFTLETIGVPESCRLICEDGLLFGWDIHDGKLCLVMDGVGAIDALESDGVLFVLFESAASPSDTNDNTTLEVRYLERNGFCLDEEFPACLLDGESTCYGDGRKSAGLMIRDGNLYVEQSGIERLYYRDISAFTKKHRDVKAVWIDIVIDLGEEDSSE